MISPSRELAFCILMEVERGAFAADLLSTRSAPLSSRDAGLAAALTLGVLRFRSQLDFLIESQTGKPVSKLDAQVREALRMGVYQLRYMDRIPPHAAVSESVELVKQNGKRSAAGLVNAVLRKVSSAQLTWPERSVALSCPEWLLSRWTRAFGADAAETIGRAALTVPARYIRVPPGAAIPPGAAMSDGSLPTSVEGCFEIPPGVDLSSRAHEIRLQDIGSQSIAPLLQVESSHRVLDLCSAPGNKTAQLRETGAWTVAADISPHRLNDVPGPKLVLDAQLPLPFLAAFDRILVDAPCSGTGTIVHNPEIKWRLTEADIARHSARQRSFLTQALAVLKPGGLLVYSTCSLEPEENEHVVEAVAPQRVVHTVRRMPGRDPGDGFFAAVLR